LTVRFARLRIAGFKSFAEAVSVDILPGLTGIVGPNGCGKSNVVEALRWAMGESSAKSLRGGEMDDVIFAGTAHRPSRNLAEVTLTLEDTAGAAPVPFHAEPELEISRRIERGSGSAYRVNGREVRQRDVQTLFADLATGARSSAMVSQGRVAALVGAKPEERRQLLEEAAGITGLRARRHEAELKLKAAEANLARSDDLVGQLEAQLANLKKQARQASRYRNLSGHIRDAEADLLALQRARAETQRAAARAAEAAARDAVSGATEETTAATAAATEAAAALPPLRSTEAEARTALERARLSREALADEERRARAALAQAESQLAQQARDLEHAAALQRDAEAAQARLAEEEGALAALQQDTPARLEAAQAAQAAAAEQARLADAESQRATEAAAELAARANALAEQLRQAEQRARRAAEACARIEAERARIEAQLVDAARIDAAEAGRAAAEQALAAARTALEEAERARTAAQAASAESRARAAESEAARAKLAAEVQALAEVLAIKDGDLWPPLVDAVEVPSGLESALGAALGEELESAADTAAPRHWRLLPAVEDAPALPDGATALATLVRAPGVLARALGQIGLVESEEAGEALQPRLRTGQSLVTRDGALWRWDGFTMRAGTPTAAAVRLTQRNRLAEARARLAEAEQAARAAQTDREQAAAAEARAAAAEQQARTARREAEQGLERARAAEASLRAQATAASTRMAGIDEQLARAVTERQEAESRLAEGREAHAALPDLGAARAAVEQARGALATARAAETTARAELASLQRESAARADRIAAIAREREAWTQRAADAAARAADLAQRREAAMAEHAALAAAPAEVAARLAESVDLLEGAEQAHRVAAQALAAAEDTQRRADRAARAAESALAAARETLVRQEAEVAAADHAWGTVAERILERLGVNAPMPDPPADLSPESEDKARRKLERLQREREEMGPVNLRAEQESEEVAARIAGIGQEREELTTAIAKLRGSIGHLNREGRERLGAVFTEVDRAFQDLFTRMFGGGRAHLALVGSDDPLEAGLEIYAQPPGKKLASLGLLSGGEQALTALSLIFAVFRANPSPICVLDEVDAPLDDANVERFCTLLGDIAGQTGTRFMVVTHHPMTMARMDRLYGVTMQERGVSRLLSVDLGLAEKLANSNEPAMVAAE